MPRKLRVLLVDDDSDDRLLFGGALKRSGLSVDLFEATDGFAAINHLLGFGECRDRAKFPFPDLVFLDLTMPGMDGFDVLNEIRTQMGLQSLPIIVFTISTLNQDMAKAYSLQASAFHQKPLEHDDLISLLKKVIPLWAPPPIPMRP